MYIILLVFLFCAAFYDVKSGRIPNTLIAAGYAVGTVGLCIRYGFWGVLIGVFYIGMVWFLSLPVYFLKGLGAGDCKLLAWIPLFIRKEHILECIFLIFLCAALEGIFTLIIKKKHHFKFAAAAFAGGTLYVLRHL